MLISARGIRINVVVRGSGRPIVFIHGFGCTHAVWDEVTERLQPGFQTLALDLRGAGFSDRTYGALGLEDLADDVEQVIGRLGLGPATIVGHSMGGMVSQHLYFAAPDLVRGLVLCGTAGAVTPAYRGATRQLADLVRTEGSSGLARAMVPGLFAPLYQQAQPAELRRFAETFEAADPLSLILTLESLEGFDLRDRLAGISVPTAIIVGEHDPFVDDCRLLGETIPGATHSLLTGVGHMTPMEAPEHVAAVVSEIANTAEGT